MLKFITKRGLQIYNSYVLCKTNETVSYRALIYHCKVNIN